MNIKHIRPDKPLVILDRDGVINEDSDAFIKSAEEFTPISGSLEAIARLHKAGYRIVIATNQSGIARGLFDLASLDNIHKKLHKLLAEHGAEVDAIFYCPHGPDDGCDCRKPLPGLLQKIAKSYALDLDAVPVIGDSLRDLESAVAVAAQPVLVRTGKGEKTLQQLQTEKLPAALKNTPVYADLSAAVAAILSDQLIPREPI
jgi:D-glycero-D-manno-heptose 1,7-bisphosphate phosphatase